MSAPDLSSIVHSDLTEVDKAVVALSILAAPGAPQTSAEIAARLEAAGSARINRARLRDRLLKDRRTIKDGDGFRIAPRKMEEVGKLALPLLGPIRPKDNGSFIDPLIFSSARSYITNIVHQINISYDNACFDCVAVMTRRLFETLLIDSFEAQGVIDEIRDQSGHTLSLSGIISKLASTQAFSVSRQTLQAAPNLKNVGDWSAHNRRHRAQKSDVESVRQHARLACAELLHLAGQAG